MKTGTGFILLFAAGLLAACSSPAQSELALAEQRWQEQGIASYRIEVLQVNSIWHAQTYVITVEDGKVVDSTSSCIPAPFEAGRCDVKPFDPEAYTVEGLFELARSRLAAESAEFLTIKYDEQYGFPGQISSDNPQAVDDDNSWSVRSFQPQP